MLSESQQGKTLAKDLKVKQILDYLQSKPINSQKEAKECFELAQRLRCVGATSMNLRSSRSHAIFVISVHNKATDTKSSLYLVDLAGSERIKKSNVSGSSIDETIAINSSLTTLGKCIIALGDKKSAHVPFRESKLTRVLQDALGGKCKTALIMTLSPQMDDLEETISSLLFGQRAKKVQCRPVVYETQRSATGGVLSEDLRRQLDMKTQLLQEVSSENRRLNAEIAILQDEQGLVQCEQIKKLESKIKQMKKEHQSRLEDMDSLLLQQEKEITKLKNALANSQHQSALQSSENQRALRQDQNRSSKENSSKKQLHNKENAYEALQNMEEKIMRKERDELRMDVEKLMDVITKKDEEIEQLRGEVAYTKEMNEGLEGELDCLEEEIQNLRELREAESEKVVNVQIQNEEDEERSMDAELEVENVKQENVIKMISQETQVNNPICETCEEENSKLERDEDNMSTKEKDLEISIIREELEVTREKLAMSKCENHSLSEEKINMTNLISELRSNEEDLLKQLDQLEKQLIDQQDVERLEIDLERASKHSRNLEEEVGRLRRREEESQYKVEGILNDLAATEAQLKMSRMKTDEIASLNSRLENLIKKLEEESSKRIEGLSQELEMQKKATADLNREKKKIVEELKVEFEEKRDLETILEEYRKKEKANQTSEQELERLKGVLLESDNWNTTKTENSRRSNLEILVEEAQVKIKEFIVQIKPTEGNQNDTRDMQEFISRSLSGPQQTIKKILTSFFTQAYFMDFEKNILGAQSGPQLQQAVVREYAKARQCLRELATNFEGLLLNLAEVELLLKFEESRSDKLSNLITKFKKTLSDPSFEQLRLHFINTYVRLIRKQRAATKIQDFFKQIKQRKKMQRLNKQHRSQYERFQAGSGKNMLQMMMKMTEDAMCEVHSFIGNGDSNN